MAVGDSVTLALGIDASGATRGAHEFEDSISRAKRAASGASDSVSGLGKTVDKLPSAFAPANSAISGFVGGLTAMASAQAINFLGSLAGQVISTGDAYQRLDSRLAMVTGSMEAGAKAHADLYDMSQRLGVSFESTGGFFNRIASQSKELGLSYEDLISVTSTLEGAFKLGGASAAETSSAMMQLGQSFASGKVQGDEFRSVAENAPVVLDLLSQALGVTRGELQEMAQSGELTSQVLAQGLLQIAPQVAEQVQSMGGTVSDETTRMMNAWSELLAEFSKTSGASEALRDALQAVTSFMESDAGRGAIRGFASEFGNLISVMTEVIKAGQGVASFLSGLRDQAMSFDKGIRDMLGGINLEKRLGLTGAIEKGATAAGGALNEGLAKLGLGQTADQRARAAISKSIPALKEPPPVTLDEIIGKRVVNETESDLSLSQTRAATFGKPKAAPRGSTPAFKLGYEAPKSSGGGRATAGPKGKSAEQLAREEESITDRILQSSMRANDQQIALIEFRRDEELQALAATSMAAEKKAALAVKVEDTAAQQISTIRQKDAEEEQAKQDAAIKSLGRYEEANLQVHGRMTELIIRQRDEELRAINADKGMTDEQKAQARVLAEDTASQQIIEIRRREADEIANLQEENLQVRASNAFGDDRKQLQKRLLEMQRDSQLADIQASKMSEDMKSQASAIKSDTFAQRIAVVDPTPWEAASRYMQEFGEGLTGVEGMTQGVIQGISSIGNTAASAFADAIMSGESFSDTLEAIGQSLTKMLLQMTMQMAMQQAIGAAVGGIGAMMAPSPAAGSGTAPAGYAGVGYGTTTMAKGGIVRNGAGLTSGIYSQPTYFHAAEPAPRPMALPAPVVRPTFSYDTAFAKGGAFDARRGVMGEAGPEAVLPLTRTPTGELGVSGGGGSTVNVTINNNSKANVTSESKEDMKGNKDIIMTIADEVETIVASRMSRSGTRVNRSVSSVGQVVAR